MCNERNIGKDDVNVNKQVNEKKRLLWSIPQRMMIIWSTSWPKILQESVKGSNRLWGRTIYIIQVVPQRILQVCQGSEIERQVLWPNSSYQQHKEQPTISSSRFRESGKDILSSPWLSYRPANSAPLISKFLEQEKPAITESEVRQEVWTSPKNKVAWSMDEIIS